MNILQYNIWDGCREEDRYARLSDWLQKQNCDVIGFNELNEWTQTEFQMEMQKIGFPYSYLFEMETSPYLVGIASKWPVEIIECMEEEPIYHGLLHAKINGIHFVIVHLTPFESAHRERETEKIRGLISAIQAPVMVMGDFNTLSPLDEKHYREMNTYEILTETHRHTRQHIQDGSINYQPMEILLDAGLHDVIHSDTFQYSMPTKAKEQLTSPKYVRLDYVLVNNDLLKYNPTGEIVREPEVETLSDHYPVRCNLKTKIGS